METMAQRITSARKAAKMTQRQVADSLDISRVAVTAWESGTSKPTGERIGKLAQLLGVTPDYFYGAGSAPAPIAAPRQPEFTLVDAPRPDRDKMPSNIPVLGTAIGGNGGDFVYEGGTVDYVRRPPGLAQAKDIFALRVVGESMYPAFREGQLVYLNPYLQPRAGDDVVIEFKPNEHDEYGQGCLKRLVRRSGSQIVVEQFNPPKKITFDMERVKKVHRVLTMSELMGI